MVFGYLASSRNGDGDVDGVQEMVGLFVDVLVARVGVGEDETVGGLLQRVQRDALEGLRHQHSASAAIQEETPTDGRSRLFNTCINFRGHNLHSSSVEGGEGGESGLQMKYLGGEDPMEVSSFSSLIYTEFYANGDIV